MPAVRLNVRDRRGATLFWRLLREVPSGEMYFRLR